MRVVIDTNQLLKMMMAGEKSPLLMAWRSHAFEVIFSTPLMAELLEVSSRPKIEKLLRFGQKQKFLQLIHLHAIWVTLAPNSPPCRDPKDDMVIATALGGQSEFIVTSDKDLLDDELLKQTLAKENLQILYPMDLLKLI